MNEEDRAKYQRRQQKQAARRLKEAEQRRLRMAQEIQRHLEEVEIKQREIEEKGVAIERALRGEGPGIIFSIFFNTNNFCSYCFL